MQKSQAAMEQTREMGVSIREAEFWLDAELFLDKYPRWDIEGPHCPTILYSMFLHATGEGWNEAERFICRGCWQSLPRPDPEENCVGWDWWAIVQPLPPTDQSANWKLSPGPLREEANMMRPSRRPDKLTSGH